jgi:Zn-dependent protease with chaperone function
MANVVAEVYPPTPPGVPSNLTTPSSSYRLRVIIVLTSLVLFVLLYVGLVAGSAYLTYYSFTQLGAREAPGDTRQAPLNKGRNPSRYSRPPKKESSGEGWWIILGIASGVFCLFLVKGLFKWQRLGPQLRVEVTEQEQPVLFAFIRQLCRDTRAPFPHRVFLTPEVNAAVFYNSSFLSLILPTPKNLLIGLGLINRLNLSEFKAVLAHEFGHFSQHSMKLGSYVYTSNRIIGDIVFARDWLDDVVAFVRRLDIRVAVFAWAFTGVLWVTRKGLQGLFRAINFANSALSRQMEFNADLVAVSVTGSDALVHSLSRLDFANQALMLAWQDLTTAADHRLYTRDLFYHQTKAAEYIRTVQQNPRLGEPPALPADPAQMVQVFEPGDDGIPLMWATHPSNFDREQNAKRHYLRSPLDERSPWVLFPDAAAVRERVTRHFYQVAKKIQDPQLADPEVVQAFIDDEHAETTFHARYHGMYDQRFIVPGDLGTLVQAAPPEFANADRLGETQAGLYGDEVTARMETYASRQGEYHVLSGLVDGSLKLKGTDFSFREGRYRPGDAKRLLRQVESELEADREWLAALDRKVFLVHHAMAQLLHPETRQELEDRYRFHLAVQDLLGNLGGRQQQVQAVLNAVAGERQLTQGDFQQLLGILRQAYQALREVLEKAEGLRLPAMKNMAVGQQLSRFLMERPLVRELTGREQSVDGKWIGQFLEQMGEVVEKMQRIHFKSLGGILTLQEKIAGQWQTRSGPSEPAPVAPSAP